MPAVLQAKGRLADIDIDRIQNAAARGTRGPGARLPYLDTIQSAFGPAHNLRSVEAHVGGSDAQQACGELGAMAYAMGHHVAFKGAPDLHTAAHEAAHVVQQRAGVQLKGGDSSAARSSHSL